MAVVTGYGTGYKNPAALKAVDAILAEAKVISINSQVAIANGDSIGSQYFVGRVPSNAIIKPTSRFDCTAVTAAAGNLGFAAAAAALLAAQTFNAALGASAVAAVSVPNLNTRAWQLAGFTADPGGMLDISLILTAAATAAGTINFSIDYARK